MAEQVEGDVAQGHVLLELGSAGYPRAQLLREDQRVVAETKRVLRHVGRCGDRAGA